jgi:hypothetical protein
MLCESFSLPCRPTGIITTCYRGGAASKAQANFTQQDAIKLIVSYLAGNLHEGLINQFTERSRQS